MENIRLKVEKAIDSKLWPIIKLTFFCVLTFILYYNYIQEDLVALNGDGLGYLNVEYYASESVKNGCFPLWNPYMSAGRPFVNDITNYLFSPIRIMFSWLSVKWFFYAFYAFHLAMGAVAFSLYLKEIKCNKWIAELMSFLYYFSICLGGYRKSHLLLIACTVYLPVVLYLIEKYYNEKNAKYLYISSLFLAFQFFTGFPQYALYTDIIAGIYLIVLECRSKFPLLQWIRDGIMWVTLYLGFALIQLIPFGELWLNYAQYGSTETTLEQFKTYSISVVKLLLMYCPTLFSAHPNSALMELGYSEIQAEMFMGTVAFSIILLSIWSFRKDYRIKLSLLFMTGIFLFAMNGTVDALAKIFYHIPIIGSFRGSSRILFAFTFFGLVVVARGMELIISERKYTDLLKVFFVEIVVLVLIAMICVVVVSLIGTDHAGSYTEIISRYSKTLIVLGLASCGTYLINRIGWNQSTCLIILVWGLILWDVYPYWKESSSCSILGFGVNNEVEKFLVDNGDEGKVILDSPYIDGNYQSALSTSFSLSLGLQAINSYTAINDPRLSLLMTSESTLEPSFNFSGLYTGFPEIDKVLSKDNDLLSMLGVKYIIDQERNVPDEEYLYGDVEEVIETQISEDVIVIPASDDVYVVSKPITLETGENYQITFECKDIDVDADVVYIDFYSPDDYDNAAQQVGVDLSKEETTYEYVLNAGKVPADSDDVSVRIVIMNSDSPITLTNFNVSRVKCEKIENPYELVLDTGDVKIYQNNNARDILYIPDSVISIADTSDIYGHNEDFDFKNISYIESDESYTTGSARITNIYPWINGVTATVGSDSKTFVNFSQASYPGWKAYVDGVETTVYEVNGYIQGIEVDSGEHEIKFVYVPVSFYVGCVGSLITLVIWSFLVFRRKAKTHIIKRNEE